MVKMMACMIRETIEETYNGMPEPELADTQFLKVMAETIYYKINFLMRRGLGAVGI